MLKLPKFIGHRGAAGFAPENTLASMRVAKQSKAQMVEFDVKQTKDGVLVIMHDDNVQRTTDGNSNVSDMSLSELRSLDAGSWFDASFAGEKVPTLAEIFHVLQELHMTANIEIKPCPNTDRILAKSVAHFIKNYWPNSLPLPIVSSFSLECLRVVRQENPKQLLALLFGDPIPSNWKLLGRELRACAISLNHKSLTSSVLIEEMHHEGYAVLAYTVNDITRVQELYAMGVDSVFTNYPGALIL